MRNVIEAAFATAFGESGKVLAKAGLATIVSLACSCGVLAADQCSAFRASIRQHGSFVYHYRDPSHPGLDLYERYVSSSLQCGGGYELESKQVTFLPGCQLPTCEKSWGESNH